MKSAAIYARFSSDMQRNESIDAQVRACKYFAQKTGYEIVHVYADRAQSGRSAQREQFQQMLRDAKNALFDTLLVHKLNRLSRSASDTFGTVELLKACGVELISVTERLDDTPEGRLMLCVITGINEFYSANLAQEVKKGLRENAYKGYFTGGTPPLGYDVMEKKLVVNPREAAAVRLIFSMYRAGHGYGEIIACLNSNGFRTKKGAKFGRNSIYEILRNERYTGVFTYDKHPTTPGHSRNYHLPSTDYIRVEGGCPAIIEKELFAWVQHRMEENRHMGAQNKAKTVYLLSGKLICGNCGHRMVGEARKARDTQYHYYLCNHAKRTKSCAQKSVRKELIEEAVLDHLNQIAFSESYIQRIVEAQLASYDAPDHNAVLTQLNTRLQEIDRQLSNGTKAILNGLDFDELRLQMAELKQEKAQLQTQLMALQATEDDRKSKEELEAFWRNFLDIKHLSPESQKAVIAEFVDKVILYDDDPGPDGGNKIHIDVVINPNHVADLAWLASSAPANPQLQFLRNGVVVLKIQEFGK